LADLLKVGKIGRQALIEAELCKTAILYASTVSRSFYYLV